MICPYPTQSDELGLISVALGKAQAAMQPIARDLENSFTHNKYASFGGLRDAVFPILAQHGITLTQTVLPWPGDPIQLTKSEVKKEVKGKDVSYQQFMVPIACVGLLRTQLTHSSGQWQASDFPIVAEWGYPQDVGSVIGHIKRYAIELICGVAKQEGNGPPPPRQSDRRDQAVDTGRASGTQGGSSSGKGATGSASVPNVGSSAPAPWVPTAGDKPLIPSTDDYDDEADHLPGPGSSGDALFSWLYERGGAENPGVAADVMVMARGQAWADNMRLWTADQAARAHAYAVKKLARVKPKTNGFKELPPMVASTSFSEFETSNSNGS